MLIQPNTQTTTTGLFAPDGSLLTKPTTTLLPTEVQLLRDYRAFLTKYRLREAVFCDACFEGDLSDGTRFAVTPTLVHVECRCKILRGT